MTLIMSIVSPLGIWQCSDNRLTAQNLVTGKIDATPRDNYASKHMQLRCPDGAALICFTGLAKIGNEHLMDWLRKQLGGETRTVDQSLIAIREAANRDLSRFLFKHRVPHFFQVGAFIHGQPWAAAILNYDQKTGEVLTQFETIASSCATKAMVLVNGAISPISSSDLTTLKRNASIKPRKQEEFQHLLASINKRAAESQHSDSFCISDTCTTTFLPPAGEPMSSIRHTWGKKIPWSDYKVNPFILFGIDVTDMEEAMIREVGDASSAK